VRAAKAWSAISGRDYVIPDDVRELAPPILAHRLLPTVEAAMNGRAPGDILAGILDAVPISGPTSGTSSS
jgi:MoxR-like ATPase